MAAHREDYERYESLPAWARATLAKHAGDPRPHLYTPASSSGGDPRRALERRPAAAPRARGASTTTCGCCGGRRSSNGRRRRARRSRPLIELNDKYALDGRDPNSYSGIFWSLGRYDRPWGPERPIFGTVRYMSSDSTRRKLKVDGYVARYGAAEGGQMSALLRKTMRPVIPALLRLSPAPLLLRLGRPEGRALPARPAAGAVSSTARRQRSPWPTCNLGTRRRLRPQREPALPRRQHDEGAGDDGALPGGRRTASCGSISRSRCATSSRASSDASAFSLDPKEDGDPDLYQAVGSTRPLEELIRRMIVRSSNLATNLLIEKIGASRAQDLMRGLGAYRHPHPARRRGRQGLPGGHEQPHHGGRPRGRHGRPRRRDDLQAGVEREDDRDPQGAGVQREDPRRPAARGPRSPTRRGTSRASTTTPRSSIRLAKRPTCWWSSPRGMRTRRPPTGRSPRSRGWSGSGGRIRPTVHPPSRPSRRGKGER